MSESIVKVSVHAGGIQIWIAIESLYDLAERNPDNPLRIIDSDKFIKEYIHQLENYAQSNDTEVGCSHIEYLIDECIQQVYENGSESVIELGGDPSDDII